MEQFVKISDSFDFVGSKLLVCVLINRWCKHTSKKIRHRKYTMKMM